MLSGQDVVMGANSHRDFMVRAVVDKPNLFFGQNLSVERDFDEFLPLSFHALFVQRDAGISVLSVNRREWIRALNLRS
jgi:hypothetical protein